jgi:hypothetical protein
MSEHECARCGATIESINDYCESCEAVEKEKWDDQDEAVTHELRTARGY